MKFTITLEKNEVEALLQLIDIAVKHAGMQVAETAVILAKKIAASPKVEETAPADEAKKE